MDRIENYTGSDGKLYNIEFRDIRYVVKRGSEVVATGQQPSGEPRFEDWAARQFAIQDIESKILADRSR